MLTAAIVALCLGWGPRALPASAPADADLDPTRRQEVEVFLRDASVVGARPLGVGVTHSHRLTLSDGSRQAWAVWKTIDDYQPLKRFYDGAPPVMGFRDSYKSEVAAYELDKLLDLEMVPPTVERRIGRRRGSLQIWVHGCITEGERMRLGQVPLDAGAWGAQVYRYRVFHQLVHDSDYRNLSNLLIDQGTHRIWVIDQSRAFATRGQLLETTYLRRYSRPLLQRLRALDRDTLAERLGRWLTPAQIDGLLARRDLLVAHADALVAERGEAAVLY